MHYESPGAILNPNKDIMDIMKYDFHGMENAMYLILDYAMANNEDFLKKDGAGNRYNQDVLRNGLISLKNELNKFFIGSQCCEVIYTNNTDKMFFGMTVMPFIDPKETYNCIEGDTKIRIDKYYLELDSKLFQINLDDKELVACLLHEVGHLVNDASPIDILKKNMAKWVVNNGTIMSTNNINYREILLYGIKDSIRKMDSIFDKKNDEVLADEFVVAYGYGEYLESALNKIVRATGYLSKNVTNNFLVMEWTLRLYNDILKRRIPALYQLRKMIDIAPSHYEREELKKLEVRLRRLDDDSILGNYIQEGGFIAKYKRNSMKGYEQELYSLTMQARNVQREEDAITIMNKINSNISVIEDYIESEELNKKDFTRWNDLVVRYHKLRSMLADRTLQGDDYNRINVNYPVIRDMREL